MKIGFACLVSHRRRCNLTRLALCKNFFSFFLPFEILAEIIIQLWHDFPTAKLDVFATRGRTSLASRHILKFLALASKPQVLENCPVLGSRTTLFFEPLKFCWKTPETSRKICEHLFCFPQLEHRRSQRRRNQGTRPLPIEISPITRMCQKSLLLLQFQFLFSIFHLQH